MHISLALGMWMCACFLVNALMSDHNLQVIKGVHIGATNGAEPLLAMDQSHQRERADQRAHKWARSGLRRAWARGNVVHAAGRRWRRRGTTGGARAARRAGMPAAAMPHRPAAHAGSGSGSSKPWMHGKNLSPGLRGEQHCEKSGALSEPSIMQKGVRL
mmetsp:Transcript_35509/g.114536  ORF Transcript_35509/g.114536 Transcript_35509/m.114536 type:complete len:159 (-) Transcript_35509:1227-1703(-)